MPAPSEKPVWETWWGRLLVRLTPPCTEVTRRISEALDHPLPPWRRVQLRLHYRVCVWCSRYEQQLRLINQTLAGASDPLATLRPETLPSDVRERMQARLAEGMKESVTPARGTVRWIGRFALAPVAAYILALGSQWCIRCVDIEGARGSLLLTLHAILSWPYMLSRSLGWLTETPQGFPLCCFIGWTLVGLLAVGIWAAMARAQPASNL